MSPTSRSQSPKAARKSASQDEGPILKIDESYTPHVFRNIYHVSYEFITLSIAFMVGMVAVLVDFARHATGTHPKRIPSSIDGLLDPKVYSALAGRRVVKVEKAKLKEQHANSTERAWLTVRYEGESVDTLVFAKCQASNILVRGFMTVFGPYRNELNAYATFRMPVSTPKVHIAQYSLSRFILVLEDLSTLGATFPNVWTTHVDKALAEKTLTTLATIHAKFWGDKVPAGVFNDELRPVLPGFMGFFTMYMVGRRCYPGLVPEDVRRGFAQCQWNSWEIRAYMSRSQPKTLCHGDTHIGNFYFLPDNSMGTFDFQVLAEENPMRDVAYFLSCSADPDMLETHEEELIRFYLKKLEELGVPKSQVPTFEQAFFDYRVQIWYTLYAWVFSGGFSNLMDHYQTETGVSRIVRTIRRIDAIGAIYAVLDGKAG